MTTGPATGSSGRTGASGATTAETPAAAGPEVPAFDTVVVTGAAGGMGTAVVADLLSRGYAVAALDLPPNDPWRDRTPTEDTTGALSEIARGTASGRLSYRGCSVSDGADVARALDEIAATMPPLLGLVNGAGTLETGPALETSDEQWRRVMDVNATGVFLVSRETLRVMVAQCNHDPSNRRGIVTISSNSAVVPRAQMAAYAASKAAATHYTTSLGLESARYGVRANVVAPGTTMTNMVMGMWDGEDRSAQMVVGDPQAYKTGIPLGRVGRPADVTGVVGFLLGESARHMTLQVLTVDGGAAQH
ncbi:2,3-dihydro-2,3-dihydroxybenzoate dehydrogenase [Kocuria varians]